MRVVTSESPLRFLLVGAVLIGQVFSAPAAAATLCVNPVGSGGCFATIQSAVNSAAPKDVINVGPGTYREGVVIEVPLSLVGAGANQSIIDATNQANGILIDGSNHKALRDVTITGFTVENAQFEGILAVSATNVAISNNSVINNDASSGLNFTGAATGCPGQPAYETDETGDCGGAIHLIGVSNSTVSQNQITGNADGILISDETAISQGNTITLNNVVNNPLECGIVLASHPPAGSSGPFFAPHYGVVGNMVTNNVSNNNGVQIGGAGVGLFSDGNGPGRVSENVVSHNTLIGNGLGGVTLHSHVGPYFGAPPDNMDNNMITGNNIASNLADTFDTATPGRVGININNGSGGSLVTGTLITANKISDEDVDIAINTRATVAIHGNALLGGNIGVANVCVFDGAISCGAIDATQNYWGCPGGPQGGGTCSTVSGPNITFTPWLTVPIP